MTDMHPNGNGHLAPSRLPIPMAVAKEYDISAPDWRVLVEQVFPTAKTVEAVMLALAYCRKRNLDVYKKPVHIVPMWNSILGRMVETVWPGIAEIRTTAMRTRDYAGLDEVVFGPEKTQSFGDGKTSKTVTFPEWASVTVHRLDRQGVPRAYKAKIFWLETYATMGKGDVPNEMWASRAYGQLDKCVEAAALRKAFPEELGSTYSAEEMEGKVIDVTPNHERPEPAKIPPLVPLPSRPAAESGRQERPAEGIPDAVASPFSPAAHPTNGPVPSEPFPELPAFLDRRKNPALALASAEELDEYLDQHADELRAQK